MQIKGIANKLWMAAEAAVFLIFLAVSIQRDFAGFLVVMFCIAVSWLIGGMYDRLGPSRSVDIGTCRQLWRYPAWDFR
jgi:hypothetical protein